MVRLGQDALFTWTPIAQDVGERQLELSAWDGELTDIRAVLITVRASTSNENVPIIRQPLGDGVVLDLSVESCLELDIVVEDQDSTDVEITQDPPIPGSTMQSTQPLRAQFHWCPTAQQQQQQRYVLRIKADDHDNPVVCPSPNCRDYAIVLKTNLGENCPGAPPTIVHTPPDPLETLDDIPLEAEVQDDQGLKESPLVYYSSTKPQDPSDLSLFTPLVMTESYVIPGVYHAYLPNPALDLAPGASATLYYVISAEDDDDPSGNCDHRVRVPKSAFYEALIFKPQTSQSCSTSNECGLDQLCAKMSCIADQCTPNDLNGDQLFFEQSTCPESYFCPAKGPGITPSHCAFSCNTDGDCQKTGYRCKVFDTKKGCAKEGTGHIGDPCQSHADCSGIDMCLAWLNGYCSISNCASAGYLSGPCPWGSVCVPVEDQRFSTMKHWICLKQCSTDADCRVSDGYTCQDVADDSGKEDKACLP